jgi:hypothetical protein
MVSKSHHPKNKQASKGKYFVYFLDDDGRTWYFVFEIY